MARFDVYRNQGRHQTTTPFLLDVQSNHLDALSTRIVIPLRRLDCFPKILLPKDLTPIFVIEGIDCLLDAPRLAAIPMSELKTKVTSLAANHSTITTSLDRLFGGF